MGTPQEGGGAPQFSAHFYCGQMAGCIEMLQPSRLCVRWGPSPLSKKGAEPPIFGPRLLWPNGCIDQDVTWYSCMETTDDDTCPGAARVSQRRAVSAVSNTHSEMVPRQTRATLQYPVLRCRDLVWTPVQQTAPLWHSQMRADVPQGAHAQKFTHVTVYANVTSNGSFGSFCPTANCSC